MRVLCFILLFTSTTAKGQTTNTIPALQILYSKRDAKKNRKHADRKIKQINKEMLLDSLNPALYHERAENLLVLNQRDSALQDFYKAFELDQNDRRQRAENYLYILVWIKNEEAAKSFTDSLTAAEPDNSEWIYVQADYLKYLGAYEEAAAIYSELISKDSTNEATWYKRAETYISAGDYDRAIEDLSAIIQRNPEDGQAHLRRGTCESLLGKKDEACRDWEKALSLNVHKAALLINNQCR